MIYVFDILSFSPSADPKAALKKQARQLSDKDKKRIWNNLSDEEKDVVKKYLGRK